MAQLQLTPTYVALSKVAELFRVSPQVSYRAIVDLVGKKMVEKFSDYGHISFNDNGMPFIAWRGDLYLREERFVPEDEADICPIENVWSGSCEQWAQWDVLRYLSCADIYSFPPMGLRRLTPSYLDTHDYSCGNPDCIMPKVIKPLVGGGYLTEELSITDKGRAELTRINASLDVLYDRAESLKCSVGMACDVMELEARIEELEQEVGQNAQEIEPADSDNIPTVEALLRKIQARASELKCPASTAAYLMKLEAHVAELEACI